MSTDRGMDKEDVVYMYYSAMKKEENNAICSNRDGPRDYHTKWSKSDRERQRYHPYVEANFFKKWNKWTYLRNIIRLTDIENKLMVTKGETWCGEMLGWTYTYHCI